MRTLLIRY
ncbi:Bcl-2-like protein, partial [Monkeypox virus]